MSRFASPTKLRSDDWGANPTPPQSFGTLGHRYVAPSCQQRLPGYSFAQPSRLERDSDGRSVSSGSRGSKGGTSKTSKRGEQGTTDGAQQPHYQQPQPQQHALSLLDLLNANANGAGGNPYLHAHKEENNNSDDMTMSSISYSRGSAPSQPRRGRDDGFDIKSVNSTSSIGSNRFQRAAKKSTPSVSSVSSTGSSSGFQFTKKMLAFAVQSPHQVDLPMAQSAFDWLLSESIREISGAADDNASTGTDRNSYAAGYFQSPDDIRASIGTLKSVYGSMCALKEHINNDRVQLNPKQSPETIFFPVQHVNSEVVYNSRFLIQRENNKWQKASEDALAIIDRKLRLLFEKRERTKQLRNRIAEVDDKIASASGVQLDLFDTMNEVKSSASPGKRAMAFAVIAAQHRKHKEESSRRNQDTIARANSINAATDIESGDGLSVNSDMVDEPRRRHSLSSYRDSKTVYDSGSVHDSMYGMSPREANRAFKVLDEMLTVPVVQSMPLNSYLQLMLAKGKMRADELEGKAPTPPLPSGASSMRSSSTPRMRRPPPAPPATGSTPGTPVTPRRRPPRPPVSNV
jgi:hypothetical protein